MLDDQAQTSTAQVTFDQGASWTAPARTMPAPIAGSLLDVAVADGLAVAVGYGGAILVYGPR